MISLLSTPLSLHHPTPDIPRSVQKRLSQAAARVNISLTYSEPQWATFIPTFIGKIHGLTIVTILTAPRRANALAQARYGIQDAPSVSLSGQEIDPGQEQMRDYGHSGGAGQSTSMRGLHPSLPPVHPYSPSIDTRLLEEEKGDGGGGGGVGVRGASRAPHDTRAVRALSSHRAGMDMDVDPLESDERGYGHSHSIGYGSTVRFGGERELDTGDNSAAGIGNGQLRMRNTSPCPQGADGQGDGDRDGDDEGGKLDLLRALTGPTRV